MAEEQRSFLIWPGGSDPALGYGSLELRRRIAQQLATGKRAFPKTKGEGLTYLGESIGEGMQYLGLQQAEKARQANLSKQARELYPDAKDTTTSDKTSFDQTNDKPFPVAASNDAYQKDRPTQVVAAPPEVAAAPAVPMGDIPAMQTTEAWPAGGDIPTFNDRFAAANAPAPDATPVRTASVSSPEVQNVFFSPQMEASMKGGSATAADVMPTAQAAAPAAAAPVTLPTETRDIPLPMGDPRTTGGVRATMEAVLSRGGYSPNAIAGIERNVRDESNFNPNLRHADQPKFSGEAHFAHGLYQEGGDEWNNYVKWIDKNAPGSDWRDPKLQTQFLAERMQERPDYQRMSAGMNEAPNSGVAADKFLRGYLKPAPEHMASRSASYLREGGMPTYASRDVGSGGERGEQVAGMRVAPGGGRAGGAPAPDELAAQRDAVAAALLQQQQQQQVQAQPQAEPTQEDRLAEAAGASARPGSPVFAPTASLGRGGTDAPLPGLRPMGSLGGIDASVEERRNGIAGALQNQQPVPEVPPENPTQPGTSSSPTTASPWTSAATSALPNPAIATDITPAPIGRPGEQVAQAQMPAPQPQPTSPNVQQGEITMRPEPKPPTPPQRLPRDAQETAAIRMKLSNPGDPDAALIADTVLKDKEQKRNDIFLRDVEKYKADIQLYNSEYAKWQDDRTGGLAKRQQEYQKGGQDIIGGPPGVGGAPATAPVSNAYIPPGYTHPDLGTERSPQRTGIPNPSPRPPNTTANKWAELQAPELQKKIEKADAAAPAFNEMMSIINLAKTHPGRKWGIGLTHEAAAIAGTDAVGFKEVNDQLKGKNFLEGYQLIKGAGQISNVEGQKTEQAIARVNTAQNQRDYDKALFDLESLVRRHYEMAERNVNRPVTAWRPPNDNSTYAPDLGERGPRQLKNGETRVMQYIGGNPAWDSSYR